MLRYTLSIAILTLQLLAASSSGQQAPDEPKVTRINKDLVQIGNIRVDTARREASVDGVINSTTMLEFVANTKGGFKAYESAIELDTDATTFNAAMILCGLDSANAVPARRHFDPAIPQGDPVEIWVEWTSKGKRQKMRAEDIVYNQFKKITFPRGPWVYTGSVFLRDGRYLADLDGVIIGFVHTPAVIIENPQSAGVGGFGSWQLNPNIGLAPGTRVRLTVRAIRKKETDGRKAASKR